MVGCSKSLPQRTPIVVLILVALPATAPVALATTCVQLVLHRTQKASFAMHLQTVFGFHPLQTSVTIKVTRVQMWGAVHQVLIKNNPPRRSRHPANAHTLCGAIGGAAHAAMQVRAPIPRGTCPHARG